MPRKPKNPPPEDSQRKGTGVVRIDADLARMLNIISTATRENVSKIISSQIRPFVERRYAEVIQQLGKEIKPGK